MCCLLQLNKRDKLTNIFTACEVEEKHVQLSATNENKEDTQVLNTGDLSNEDKDWLQRTIAT